VTAARRELLLYTDGGLRPDPALPAGRGRGGIGAVCVTPQRAVVFEMAEHFPGGTAGETNQRMELMAAIRGLEHLQSLGHTDSTTSVLLHSDSAYVINCMRQEWYVSWMCKSSWRNSSGAPVENSDLWRRLLSRCSFVHRNVGRAMRLSAEDSAVVEQSRRSGLCVTFVKVKGHSNDALNNRADFLATSGKNGTVVLTGGN
jgi:ribonuclease HI